MRTGRTVAQCHLVIRLADQRTPVCNWSKFPAIASMKANHVLTAFAPQ
jgi:hypothetical protein